jgi:hypothetical protein
MVPDGAKWRDFLNVVIKLQVPYNVSVLLISGENISFSKGNETIRTNG